MNQSVMNYIPQKMPSSSNRTDAGQSKPFGRAYGSEVVLEFSIAHNRSSTSISVAKRQR